MGYGGATFESAGALSFGSGNTFDLADVTEGGVEAPYNHAWWTYTPATTVSVSLDTFGSTYAGGGDEPDTLIQVFPGDGSLLTSADGGALNPGAPLLDRLTAIFNAGNEYTILVGTADPTTVITTYQLNLSDGPPLPTVADAYSIPGRLTAGAGGAGSGTPTPITVKQVSAATPLEVAGSGWWRLTVPEAGQLYLDSLLSFTTDERLRIPDEPGVALWLYTTGLSLLTTSSEGFDPDFGETSNRAALTYDFAAGDYLVRLISDFSHPAATVFLRVSDYPPVTDWVTDDPVPIVAGPPSGMSWDHLPTAEGYPAPDGYQPAVLPDPVVFDTPGGELTTYLDPWDTGIGFEGSATMAHTPDPTETAPHPYEVDSNWEQIWEAALQGITRQSFDASDPTTNDAFLTDADGNSGAGEEAPPNSIWLTSHTFLDWPIGRQTESSAIDLSPPDGHQTIADTTYEAYWQASLTKALQNGFITGYQLNVTLTGEEPTDAPAEGGPWNLQWRTGDSPTLLAVEARNVGRSDGDLPTGALDTSGKWAWYASLYPLTWDGDAEHQNGSWLMNSTAPDVFDPATSAEGDVYTAEVVDGAVVDNFHDVIGGSHTIPGELVASIDPMDTDWVPIMDAETVTEALAYEAPLVETGVSMEYGAVWLGGILRTHVDTVAPYPTLPLGPITINAFSTLQFPGLRFTFQRDDHRWVGTPAPPDVVATSTIPPRRIFGRSDGATHGARRTLGGGNTRQAGNRTLGSIL